MAADDAHKLPASLQLSIFNYERCHMKLQQDSLQERLLLAAYNLEFAQSKRIRDHLKSVLRVSKANLKSSHHISPNKSCSDSNDEETYTRDNDKSRSDSLDDPDDRGSLEEENTETKQETSELISTKKASKNKEEDEITDKLKEQQLVLLKQQEEIYQKIAECQENIKLLVSRKADWQERQVSTEGVASRSFGTQSSFLVTRTPLPRKNSNKSWHSVKTPLSLSSDRKQQDDNRTNNDVGVDTSLPLSIYAENREFSPRDSIVIEDPPHTECTPQLNTEGSCHIPDTESSRIQTTESFSCPPDTATVSADAKEDLLCDENRISPQENDEGITTETPLCRRDTTISSPKTIGFGDSEENTSSGVHDPQNLPEEKNIIDDTIGQPETVGEEILDETTNKTKASEKIVTMIKTKKKRRKRICYRPPNPKRYKELRTFAEPVSMVEVSFNYKKVPSGRRIRTSNVHNTIVDKVDKSVVKRISFAEISDPRDVPVDILTRSPRNDRKRKGPKLSINLKIAKQSKLVAEEGVHHVDSSSVSVQKGSGAKGKKASGRPRKPSVGSSKVEHEESDADSTIKEIITASRIEVDSKTSSKPLTGATKPSTETESVTLKVSSLSQQEECIINEQLPVDPNNQGNTITRSLSRKGSGRSTRKGSAISSSNRTQAQLASTNVSDEMNLEKPVRSRRACRTPGKTQTKQESAVSKSKSHQYVNQKAEGNRGTVSESLRAKEKQNKELTESSMVLSTTKAIVKKGGNKRKQKTNSLQIERADSGKNVGKGLPVDDSITASRRRQPQRAAKQTAKGSGQVSSSIVVTEVTTNKQNRRNASRKLKNSDNISDEDVELQNSCAEPLAVSYTGSKNGIDSPDTKESYVSNSTEKFMFPLRPLDNITEEEVRYTSGLLKENSHSIWKRDTPRVVITDIGSRRTAVKQGLPGDHTSNQHVSSIGNDHNNSVAGEENLSSVSQKEVDDKEGVYPDVRFANKGLVHQNAMKARALRSKRSEKTTTKHSQSFQDMLQTGEDKTVGNSTIAIPFEAARDKTVLTESESNIFSSDNTPLPVVSDQGLAESEARGRKRGKKTPMPHQIPESLRPRRVTRSAAKARQIDERSNVDGKESAKGKVGYAKALSSKTSRNSSSKNGDSLSRAGKCSDKNNLNKTSVGICKLDKTSVETKPLVVEEVNCCASSQVVANLNQSQVSENQAKDKEVCRETTTADHCTNDKTIECPNVVPCVNESSPSADAVTRNFPITENRKRQPTQKTVCDQTTSAPCPKKVKAAAPMYPTPTTKRSSRLRNRSKLSTSEHGEANEDLLQRSSSKPGVVKEVTKGKDNIKKTGNSSLKTAHNRSIKKNSAKGKEKLSKKTMNESKSDVSMADQSNNADRSQLISKDNDNDSDKNSKKPKGSQRKIAKQKGTNDEKYENLNNCVPDVDPKQSGGTTDSVEHFIVPQNLPVVCNKDGESPDLNKDNGNDGKKGANKSAPVETSVKDSSLDLVLIPVGEKQDLPAHTIEQTVEGTSVEHTKGATMSQECTTERPAGSKNIQGQESPVVVFQNGAPPMEKIAISKEAEKPKKSPVIRRSTRKGRKKLSKPDAQLLLSRIDNSQVDTTNSNTTFAQKKRRTLFNSKENSMMTSGFLVLQDTMNATAGLTNKTNTSAMPPTLAKFLKSFVAPKLKQPRGKMSSTGSSNASMNTKS